MDINAQIPASVQRYDLDNPDVIDLRRQLFPARDNYRMTGAPLDDLRWLDDIPLNHPGLLIAEGVLHYLSETEVLSQAIVAAFHVSSF